MKYIANLCATYGHNMLLLLSSVLFPSQLYVLMPPPPPPPPKKAIRYPYTDGHKDRQTLTPFRSFRSWGFAIGFPPSIHMTPEI